MSQPTANSHSMTRHSITRMVSHPGLPVAMVATLAGMSLVMLCEAFTECAYLTMDASPLTFRLAVAAAMLATAMGPTVLARVVRLLRNITFKNFDAHRVSESGPARASQQQAEDHELRWMITSVVAMIGCVMVLALPEVFAFVHRLKATVVREFLWADISVSMLEGLVLFAIAALPFSFLGLLVRCAHQISETDGRWRLAASAWLLTGAGFGCMFFPLLMRALGDSFLLMRLACGPLAMVALIATWQVSRKKARSRHPDVESLTEPEFGQRWPTVLRLALAVLVASVVCAGFVWVYVASTVRLDQEIATYACSGLFIAAAFGIFLANRRAHDGNELVGVFGQSAVAAGIALAASVAGFNLVLRECDAPFVQSLGFVLLWGMCGCAPVLFAAYAIGVGSISLLRRHAYRGQQGATLLWMTFAVVAVVLLCVAPALMRRLGSFATLTAAALSMVATGGILIIHGPTSQQGPYRARLVGVFAVVLMMMWTMPHFGRGWLSDQQHSRELIAESTWMSYYFDSSGRGRPIHAGDDARRDRLRTSGAFSLRGIDRAREARVGVLDLTGAGFELLPPSLTDNVDAYSFDLHLRERITGRGGLASPVMSWPQLRSSCDAYDLLVVSLAELPPRALRKTVNRWFLETSMARLSGDGVLMLVLPLDEAEIVTRFGMLADSFGKSNCYCGVSAVEAQGKTMVSIFMGKGKNAESNIRNLSPRPIYEPRVLFQFATDQATQLSHAGVPAKLIPRLAAAE
ncbi:MAG: hypothetical protein KDA54_16240 [Phycisphaerales bacterium]|nr:hypothetical protein [Phycisphaerales bacterium]